MDATWAKIGPLAKADPFSTDDFTDALPFCDDVAEYLTLAANHADKMAERLEELRRDLLPVLTEMAAGKESFVMVDGRGLPVAKATVLRLMKILEAAEGR